MIYLRLFNYIFQECSRTLIDETADPVHKDGPREFETVHLRVVPLELRLRQLILRAVSPSSLALKSYLGSYILVQTRIDSRTLDLSKINAVLTVRWGQL